MKYQVLIDCDSHEELGEVVQALGRVPSGKASSTPVHVATIPSVGMPQPGEFIPGALGGEEDEDELPLNPAAIFGSPNAAEVFAPNPNAGATAVTTPQIQHATTAALQPQTGVELDPRGFPWDNRIHSANKTRLKGSDTWKYMRGVSQEVINAVEAELRSKGYGVEGTGTAPVTKFVQNTPVVQPATETPMGLPGLPTPTASGPTALSVKERLTRAIASQLVTAEWILQLLRHFGVDNLQVLEQHPDKVPLINAHLDGCRAHAGYENI